MVITGGGCKAHVVLEFTSNSQNTQTHIHYYVFSVCATVIANHTICIQIGSTPLITASINGHDDVAHALIEGGADVNQTSVVWCLLQLEAFIRESVDSLCRDGAGPPIVCVHWKAVLTHERLCSKPFWTPSYPIPTFLYPMSKLW